MTRIDATDLDPEVGNIDRLLAHRGRASTPKPPNESKQQLADVLRIKFHSANPFHSDRKIAAIVHDEMYDELEKTYAILPLLPTCLVRSVDASQPNMLVIHRAAFENGPWYGAEDAIGGALVDVIRRLLPWSRKRNVPVLFIDNGQPDGFFTPHLREIATQIFPSEEFSSRLPEGAPPTVIYQIAQAFSRRQAVDRTDGDV